MSQSWSRSNADRAEGRPEPPWTEVCLRKNSCLKYLGERGGSGRGRGLQCLKDGGWGMGVVHRVLERIPATLRVFSRRVATRTARKVMTIAYWRDEVPIHLGQRYMYIRSRLYVTVYI